MFVSVYLVLSFLIIVVCFFVWLYCAFSSSLLVLKVRMSPLFIKGYLTWVDLAMGAYKYVYYYYYYCYRCGRGDASTCYHRDGQSFVPWRWIRAAWWIRRWVHSRRRCRRRSVCRGADAERTVSGPCPPGQTRGQAHGLSSTKCTLHTRGAENYTK